MNKIIFGKTYNCGMMNYHKLDLLFKNESDYEFVDYQCCCYENSYDNFIKKGGTEDDLSDDGCLSISEKKFDTILCGCDGGEECICFNVNVKVDIMFKQNTETNDMNLTMWFDSVLILENLKMLLKIYNDEDKLDLYNDLYLLYNEKYDILFNTLKLNKKIIKIQNKLKNINFILYQSKLDGNCRDLIIQYI